MAKEKTSFEEFLSAVVPEHQVFVGGLNNKLIDQNACSSTCVKGIVYVLNGNTHKKCRNDGMIFLLTSEMAEHIAQLVCAEVTVRKSAL